MKKLTTTLQGGQLKAAGGSADPSDEPKGPGLFSILNAATSGKKSGGPKQGILSLKNN